MGSEPHQAKVYLAGPMRHLPHCNHPAFAEATKKLRDGGLDVWSPAEDDVVHGYNPDDLSTYPPFTEMMRRDLAQITQRDTIAVLPGWEKSEGSSYELAAAKACGLRIIDANTRLELPIKVDIRCSLADATGEVMQVDPKTGGRKGGKLARFDLIPTRAMFAVAQEYAADNLKADEESAWGQSQQYGWCFRQLVQELSWWWENNDCDDHYSGDTLALCLMYAMNLYELWDGPRAPRKSLVCRAHVDGVSREDLIPPRSIWALAEVYGHGARKYEDRNWERGYPWGWSYAAAMRHAWTWWGGELVDKESRSSHLAHLMWHCVTLWLFEHDRLGTDDRPTRGGDNDGEEVR